MDFIAVTNDFYARHFGTITTIDKTVYFWDMEVASGMEASFGGVSCYGWRKLTNANNADYRAMRAYGAIMAGGS